MRPQPFDGGPDAGLEIVERAERHVDALAGGVREPISQSGLVDAEQPAARVADDDDLVGAEQLLADDQRADRVLGREAAGVADDVGVAGA